MSSDDEDGLLEGGGNSSSEDEDIVVSKKRKLDKQKKPKKKKKKRLNVLIDDAAEESGEEDGNNDDDDEEDEDDDPNNNEYQKDGFVVDEPEEDQERDDLEDSDDEDDDDDDDDDERRPKKKKGRLQKTRRPQLDEDDLALIQEARGLVQEREQAERNKSVVAHDEQELRNRLFQGGEEGDTAAVLQKPNRRERFDDEGWDDFIEDDIGDQGDIMAADGRAGYDEGGMGNVSEEQLNEASEIFGTDYLDFMNDNQDADAAEEDLFGKPKFRERGVGVDYGVDSEDELISDEEDDELFGEDEDHQGLTPAQKIEAIRLKKEKREMAKAERRKLAKAKKNQRRKAQLRRAFEPVQLIEKFCTERDDEIRATDAPERFFDWTVPFHGTEAGPMNEEEEEEALWIVGRIPDIAAEFFSHASETETPEEMDARQNQILLSIVHALRFMHKDKLEPPFIKRYRQDIVTSLAVRENLYAIMDEDGEWDRLTNARNKVEALLESITEAAGADEAKSAEKENIKQLKEQLNTAKESLEQTARKETAIKEKLAALSSSKDDEEDDELFGEDDDDDEDEAKKTEKEHLVTTQTLMQAQAEKVAQLTLKVQEAEAQDATSLSMQTQAVRVTEKICRQSVWNAMDYYQYLSGLTDVHHIVDMNGYLNLVKEGNDAIRKKEHASTDDPAADRKRSRRFDRDFYRTCVSEGLRKICYKFLLAPYRLGVKLEDTTTEGSFNFSKAMPGEGKQDGTGDPLLWVPPTIVGSSPTQFASELVGSGDLVLLSSTSGADPDDSEAKDPLRGCRYVAAMELAHEPRIRRYLRTIFRSNALLTTQPTKKGSDNIDPFHDYYGLHLIRNKPVKEHFPLDERESEARKASLGPEERKELDAEMKKRERESCLQFLHILQAESTGDVTVSIHLPFLSEDTDWYLRKKEDVSNRELQQLAPLMQEMEKLYLPPDGDTDEWNDERRKVLRFALVNFLLPQFEAEVRRDLREAATKAGVAAAAENLRGMAMEGPYRPAVLAHTENRFLVPTGDLPMVGVCCSSDPKEATYLASVTARGEMNDHLAIPGGTRIDSGKMREKVFNFLFQARPAAIVVGAGGGFESRMMNRKLGELVNEAIRRWENRDIQGEDEDEEDFLDRRDAFRQFLPREVEDDDYIEWKCNVDLVDDSVPQLFGRSVRGKKEFPEASVNLRIAASVARHAQSPLGELASTWGAASDAGIFGTEMLFLNIHPMQRLLPKTLLLRHYERVLCDVVAEVGVDVNTACSFDHLHGLLSFVPGLGPRKAASLKQSLVQMGGVVGSRRELLEKRLLGPIVYNNAVAFIRIRDIDQLSNQFLHPLDDTRLHPDVYHRNNWAVKIAVDALERMDDDTKNKESAAIKALRDVMDNSSQEVERLFKATKAEWEKHYGPTFNIPNWNPRNDVPAESWRDKVEELDLDTFAQMIEQGGHGRWHSHLQMIKWEFRLPFVDPRKPMEPLSGDKLFRLVTGETDQTLRPGKEVTGKVVMNGDFGSRVKLEGNVPAFIPLRNLADEHVEAAEDIVAVGEVVPAIITEVKKDHMSVDMSLRMEDFRKNPTEWERPASLPPIDDHFDRSAASRIEEKKKKEREIHLEKLRLRFSKTKIGGDDGVEGEAKKFAPGRVTRRACAHPAFRNARQDEVDKELRELGDAATGEALIRPSSKNSNSLAIHWVVKSGSIKVIEVVEEDKDTDASIGNTLKVKNEVYGSIDELLGRYIAPMNDYVEELVNHRKFLDLPEDDVDDHLRAEKKKNPKGVFYNVCWMEMHPGYASLRFILSSTPRQHHIGICPAGYVWGASTFSNLDKLLNEFKKNPRGSSVTSSRSSRSSAKLPASTPEPPSEASSTRSSRFGERPPAPPGAPSWSQPPLPPAPPAQAVWGAAQASGGQWSQPPPRPPPPGLPPPPSRFQPPPPSRPPPPANFVQPPPPPTFGQPPPQAGYGGQYQPPPPPGGPPGYPPRVQH